MYKTENMAKKIIYGFTLIVLAAVTVLLVFFKVRENRVQEPETPAAQTIIPAAFSKITALEERAEADSASSNAKIFLELYNDEIFVDAVSSDLNGDGVEDQIIAVKKLLDPFLYLIISIQNPITQKWGRTEEIRTAVTQPKSLTFYAMELEDSLPAIIYSGMSSDNGQTFSIQKIKKDKKDRLEFSQIADLHADIQIRFIANKGAGGGLNTNYGEAASSEPAKTFADYKIYTYNSDAESPNTLDQIQTEYVWSNKTGKYERGRETKIAGEKIENQLLRKLQAGNMESFAEFLSGVWYLPSASQSTAQSIYFDKKDGIIIFNKDKIEEVYEIQSTLPRRYGLFFNANNKSIPNIIRRIDVEIKGIDEIQVRIIEDVSRIRFATASLWSGQYKKNTGLLQITAKAENPAVKLKNALLKSENAWDSSIGSVLELKKNTYRFKKENKSSTGYFDIINIHEKLILQMKNTENKNSFYLILLEEEAQKQTISLTKIQLNISEIMPTGDETVIFTRKI